VRLQDKAKKRKKKRVDLSELIMTSDELEQNEFPLQEGPDGKPLIDFVATSAEVDWSCSAVFVLCRIVWTKGWLCCVGIVRFIIGWFTPKSPNLRTVMARAWTWPQSIARWYGLRHSSSLTHDDNLISRIESTNRQTLPNAAALSGYYRRWADGDCSCQSH
jgi:hypothetical protein